MKHEYDVIIVGGGLAGLTAALHLHKEGHGVLVIEKNTYPRHKVCGEYLSNEVLPYLDTLGINLPQAGAVAIDTLFFSTADGHPMETSLPLGGQGISRYALDDLLYREVLSQGIDVLSDRVVDISYNYTDFKVVTKEIKTITSKVVIGAYGKRGGLDKRLDRPFMAQKSSWMAVKSHYGLDSFPEHMVALHNFPGGYGGLSKTESGAVNFCYLAHYQSFQKVGNIEDYNEQVVATNPFLKDFLSRAKPIFRQPLAIAQISFHPKAAVENHVLMCGDAAGLIHPLCGNGMAMAVHGAKMAAEATDRFLKDGGRDREGLERGYQREWHKAFRRRLWYGRNLQHLFMRPRLSSSVLGLLVRQPFLLKKIINATHGQPL
ncbi:NAD(P)/FAD-dependent oxidoreductase [Pseudozobellia thermophila]|uniref:Dehydrogenase (Flavoprotein) n=1 Tax=Pseudozobellia thermophila TaxID=192903 RepID=A0A1M6PAB9_9FLAO|nr:NAD(P)/FAD-dependent oxidoreductase [Pseudozobellia thermophila]SHK04877.1 Dehydrogenase (flavoprotein) [Pseudozobellia thermophila]